MTIDQVRSILACITFLDRAFVLMPKGDGYLLQVQYLEADVHTGKVEMQKARKWYISAHATETEIVETAFAACERSRRHILGEHFKYRGRRVYSPHFEIRARMDLCDEDRFDERPAPPAKVAGG